ARRQRRRHLVGLGLGDRLEMPGFVANPFALMREADLLLATSDFEGLPNVLIEAQGLGLPAVATRCPHGPDEIVSEGATGRLYPVRDVASGVEAVLELGRDAERRRAMGEAARSQARERFDLPRVLPRWQSLLLAAAGRSA
ncbi:MAG TPA: glycosyltransferase, partial [Thermoanaerobaculia bacterium]|nr:glycosyltransferase [Thermoanaerobaculia bacterium]